MLGANFELLFPAGSAGKPGKTSSVSDSGLLFATKGALAQAMAFFWLEGHVVGKVFVLKWFVTALWGRDCWAVAGRSLCIRFDVAR